MKKGFLTGFVTAILVVCLVGSAMAATGSKMAELVYKNIKIVLNGEELSPKDANGDTVEPFIIGGTTYLPVRAVSEVLGLDVSWDGKTNTVSLTDPNFKMIETPVFEGEEYELKPGGVFVKGCYVVVDGVKIGKIRIYSFGENGVGILLAYGFPRINVGVFNRCLHQLGKFLRLF
jgi:hypothetical protein